MVCAGRQRQRVGEVLLEDDLVVGGRQAAAVEGEAIEARWWIRRIADQARADRPIAGAQGRFGNVALVDGGHAVDGGQRRRLGGGHAGDGEIGHAQLDEYLVVRSLQVAPRVERGAEQRRAEQGGQDDRRELPLAPADLAEELAPQRTHQTTSDAARG